MLCRFSWDNIKHYPDTIESVTIYQYAHKTNNVNYGSAHHSSFDDIL